VAGRFNAFHRRSPWCLAPPGPRLLRRVDVNANRLDDRDHGVPGPYHDVHARVDGFAAGELADLHRALGLAARQAIRREVRRR
jgi:hypothetical protein